MATYSINVLAELIRNHLILSEDSPDAADTNPCRLVGPITSMDTRPTFQPIQWLFCDRCGCSVDTDVVAEDGSNWTSDGDVLCSSSLYPDEE